MAPRLHTRKPKTDVFTPSDTDIDRRQCRRVVPMRILALGLSRTALREAVQILGFDPTYHMLCASTENHEETSPLHVEKILPGNNLVGWFGVHPITPWDYFHINPIDNASNSWKPTATQFCGLIISVDHTTQTATLQSVFDPPLIQPHNQTDPLSAGSQANLQVLENGGNAFVGWGEYPYFSEHGVDGEPVLWGSLARNHSFMMHYRAQKFNWSATPRDDPTMFVFSRAGTSTPVFKVWYGSNGLSLRIRGKYQKVDNLGEETK